MDVIVPKTIGTSSLARASTASYFNSGGKMVYAPINTLRINYNPANLALPPLPLIENLGSNSPQLTSSDNLLSGTTTGATLYTNTIKAPDGSYTASLLVESTANSAHSLSFTASSPSLGLGVMSVYAKASTRTQFALKTTNGTPSITKFDLSALTTTVLATGTYSPSASIQDVGGGWYRCSVSGFLGGFIIELYNGSETYTGDGVSGMFFWGVQYEDGGVGQLPSSYIPSTQAYVSGGGSRYRTTSTGSINLTSNSGTLEYTSDDLAVAPKLYLEPSITNMLLRSTDFSAGSGWSISGGSLSSNSADPSGGTTGNLVADTSSTSICRLFQTLTIPNDSSMMVFSVFIRKTTAATMFAGITVGYSGGFFPTSAGVTINTNTGALAAAVAEVTFPYTMEARSYSGFWRVYISLPNNSSGNTTATVAICPSVNTDASGTWSVTPTGNCIVWGAQLELGYYPTSLVRTLSSAVTAPAYVYTSGSNNRQPDVPSFGLIYTNIPENELPTWDSATTYGVSVAGTNSVIYKHVRYASLQASNSNHQPDISPTWWSVLGATNAYSMIDTQVGTQTVGTVGGHIISYLAYGALSSLNFINANADTITVTIYSNYQQVYTTTIDMTGGSTGVPVTDYSLTGLPIFADAYAVIDVYAATTAPALGNLVVGTKYYVGSTETSPTIGIVDYAVKNIDAFGNPTLTKRGYAKRMNTKQLLDDSTVDTVARLMASVRATPCVWNANTTMVAPNSNSKTSLIVYGYYKDWEIDMAYSKLSYMTCTIEGLI